MKDVRLLIDLWTRAAINDRSVASELLAALAPLDARFFPVDWTNLDRTIYVRSPEDVEELLEFWTDESAACGGSLCGTTGACASFLVSFLSKPSREEHMLCYKLRLPYADLNSKLDAVVQVFCRWAEAIDADFGRICTDHEWESKNVIINYIEADCPPTSRKVFHQDITAGLPGVYWGTYFGSAYVRWFGGRKRFTLAPWPHIKELGRAVLLIRSDSPLTWRDEAHKDRQLRDCLGSDAFFDIEHRNRELSTPGLKLYDHYRRRRVVPHWPVRGEREQPFRRARGAERCLEDIPNADDLLSGVAYFRRLGFFADWSTKDDEELAADLYDLHERQWGTSFSTERWLADLELICWDTLRVWWNDTEASVGSMSQTYIDVVLEWAGISRGRFQPSDVDECWETDLGPITVSFQLDGKMRTVQPKAMDDYIDVDTLMSAFNAVMRETDMKFCRYEPFDQTAFVVALTVAERAQLEEERGWRLSEPI